MGGKEGKKEGRKICIFTFYFIIRASPRKGLFDAHLCNFNAWQL
jgi:hypothetical protein